MIHLGSLQNRILDGSQGEASEPQTTAPVINLPANISENINSGIIAKDPTEIQTLEELRYALKSSFLNFTRYFYYVRSGRSRKFIIPHTIGRESHYITIAKALTRLFKGETRFLMINVPPRHGKSTMMQFFTAWAYAWFADCNFLYISFAHELAAEHTSQIKQIMSLPDYQQLFGISIKHDTKAKDSFATERNGQVKAFGSKGAVTGQNAGLPFQSRFTGAVIIDDIHKPDEVHSDTLRNNVKRIYSETIKTRAPGSVPIVAIGHILHEDDCLVNMLNGTYGEQWEQVELKALDEVENALCPSIISKEELLTMREKEPYKFWSQYQQNPQPSGGSLFRETDFFILEQMPKILATFITIDTAETDKTVNDATVFSLWGIYKVTNSGFETDVYALHWIACDQIWVEPKDLQSNFYSFYGRCMTFAIKPNFIAIERKSTGTTLASILQNVQGLNIVDIAREGWRDGKVNSKANRFLACQKYISEHLVTLPYGSSHTKMCIDHMKKITANNTHAKDDIADTCADAIKIALIDKIMIGLAAPDPQAKVASQEFGKALLHQSQTQTRARDNLWKAARLV